jgi:hypothetical protein
MYWMTLPLPAGHDDVPGQGPTGPHDDLGEPSAATVGDAPYGRCRCCRDPPPAAAATGGPRRRREYHRKGESRDCKDAARWDRSSAAGSVTPAPRPQLYTLLDDKVADAEIRGPCRHRDRAARQPVQGWSGEVGNQCPRPPQQGRRADRNSRLPVALVSQ